MAQVSYEVSTAFLARMRAVIVAEQPALAGQSNTVINEAARVRIRQMARDWVRNHEQAAATRTATAAVAIPTDTDIA